jgi:hypothetical protein
MTDKVFAIAMAVRLANGHHIAPVFICHASNEESAEANAMELYRATIIKIDGEDALEKCEVLAYSAIEVPISVFDNVEVTNG